MNARLICCEVNYGDAVNVGGPARITYKTFEVELPPEMVAWLAEAKGPQWCYTSRTFQGLEMQEPQP